MRAVSLNRKIMNQKAPTPDFDCARTIVLIGMMGAGKSTVGRRLAPRLGLPFKDADDEIESASGMTVSELFELHGEESFREGEARVMKRLLSNQPLVLATGGGAVLHEKTRALIKNFAISIWLRADIDTLAQRATRRNTRPLLQKGDPVATLRAIAEKREPIYAAADIHVDTQPGPHEMTVNAIVQKLRDYCGEDAGLRGNVKS